jgi:hypothetical protein
MIAEVNGCARITGCSFGGVVNGGEDNDDLTCCRNASTDGNVETGFDLTGENTSSLFVIFLNSGNACRGDSCLVGDVSRLGDDFVGDVGRTTGTFGANLI